MLRFIGDLIERAAIVLLALLFVQLPLFIQHYEQQLVGRIAELELQVNAMKMVAQGRPLEVYIQKFIASSDPDFSNQGLILKDIVERYDALTEAFTHLMNATVYTKPYVFFSHLYKDVAMSTWEHFSFGLPLTLEGAGYAFVGVLFGMLVGAIIRLCFRKGAKHQLRTGKEKS